jgi:uncharacterized iron-regulated membrane protein
MALVLAVSTVVWVVIGFAVLFVIFMAVGRWMIREGPEFEKHHRPEAEDGVDLFERERSQSRRESRP